MSQTDYTLVLPAFTIGVHAYDAIGKITRHFGKKVVIIGGKTALSKAKQPLLDAIAKTDLEVLGVLWYGDDATYEHVDRLLREQAVQDADLVFAVGGGRAIDTCKVVADRAGKALFAFPTLASNCAPSTPWLSCTKPINPLPATTISTSRRSIPSSIWPSLPTRLSSSSGPA